MAILPSRWGYCQEPYVQGVHMNQERVSKKPSKGQQSKRPFAKSDFDAVLKSATKPLKKEQAEKESKET